MASLRFSPGLLSSIREFGSTLTDSPAQAAARSSLTGAGAAPASLGGMLARNVGGLLGRDMRTPQEKLSQALAQVDPNSPDAEEQQLAALVKFGSPAQQVQAAQRLTAQRKEKETKQESREIVGNLVATRFKDREDVDALVSLAEQGASFTDIEKAANEKETSALSPADRFKVVKGSVFDVVNSEFIAAPENLSEEAKRTQVIKTTDDDGNEISRLINLDDGETIAEYAVPKDPVGQSATALRINTQLIKEAQDFEKRASSADSILSKLEKLEGDVRGGVFNTLEEGFKQLTGTQDDVSMLRMEQRRLITSAAVANLPRGPASDKDVALVLSGELDFNAGPEAIAAYARGIKKIAQFAARQARDQAQWLDRYGDVRGFNSQQIVNKSKQELANINSPASKIPQASIERMLTNRGNVQARQDFIKRYEVDLIQILGDMERATATLSQLDRGF